MASMMRTRSRSFASARATGSNGGNVRSVLRSITTSEFLAPLGGREQRR